MPCLQRPRDPKIPQKCPKIKPANAPLDGEAGTVVSQVVPLVPDPVVVVDLVLPDADMSNSIKTAIRAAILGTNATIYCCNVA